MVELTRMRKVLLLLIGLIISFVFGKRAEAISPTGFVDVINCSHIAGWVVDEDKIDEVTDVAVYSDKESETDGGIFWGWFSAGNNRPDLPFNNKNHGFDFELPNGLKNGREHKIWIYGIDRSGDEHFLMRRDVVINCGEGEVVIPKSTAPSNDMWWIDPYMVLNNQKKNRFNLTNKNEFEEVSSRQFFLVALQGLVNRKEPRIYVADKGYDLVEWGEDYWKGEVEKSIGKTMTSVFDNDPVKLAEKFKNEKNIKGLAIYDKSMWTSFEYGDGINLMTGYCAINDCLPVSVELEAELRNRGFNWSVIADFRGINLNNPVTKVGFSWNHEGMNRYLSEILPKDANNSTLGYLQPQFFVLPRDYYFANKILPVFIREGVGVVEERSLLRLMEKAIKSTGIVLGQAGSHNQDWIEPVLGRFGTPIRGKYEEGITESKGLWGLTSERGLSLTYIHGSANLSVHSGFSEDIKEPKKCNEESLDNGKVYVNFNLSDGDNISWVKQLWRESWDGGDRSQPITWSYNPIMADLQPLVLKWFFENSGPNDSWIGWGGFNSIEVNSFDPLDKFVDKSCDYMNNLGSKKIYLTFSGIKPEKISAFAQSNCFEGIFSDYNVWLGSSGLPSRSYGNASYVDSSTVVARPIVTLHLVDGQTEVKFVEQLEKYTPSQRPAFLSVWVLGNKGLKNNRQELEDIISRIDKNVYKVVGIDDFINLSRQANGLVVDKTNCNQETDCTPLVNASITDLVIWYGVYRNGGNDPKANFDCENGVDIADLIYWYGKYRD